MKKTSRDGFSDRLKNMGVQHIGMPAGEQNLIVVRQLKEGDEQRIGDIASRAFPRLGLARLAIDSSLPVDAVIDQSMANMTLERGTVHHEA